MRLSILIPSLAGFRLLSLILEDDSLKPSLPRHEQERLWRRERRLDRYVSITAGSAPGIPRVGNGRWDEPVRQRRGRGRA